MYKYYNLLYRRSNRRYGIHCGFITGAFISDINCTYLDSIPSTHLGFRCGVRSRIPVSERRGLHWVIKSGRKSQSNPSTMQREGTTIWGREGSHILVSLTRAFKMQKRFMKWTNLWKHLSYNNRLYEPGPETNKNALAVGLALVVGNCKRSAFSGGLPKINPLQ